ncbi:MAG: hypothetical protein JWM87_1356 [Candidatus Eremiobacteraeota bacterium]|nr:hypothetical protein [Candidatus Eremiobacteraeota bacterium]
MTIPSASSAGYERLRQRVQEALDYNAESPGVEFKESRPWSSLRVKIAKTAMAMANLRDGGLLIVGRGNGHGRPEGMSSEDFADYDGDTIRDFVDSYASPSVQLAIASVEVSERLYIAIDISQFTELPVICKKAYDPDLKSGAIYIRPYVGRPRSRGVETAEDLRELLEIAAELQARKLMIQARRAGFEVSPPDRTARDLYASELGGLHGV